jgi:hypothetical protein
MAPTPLRLRMRSAVMHPLPRHITSRPLCTRSGAVLQPGLCARSPSFIAFPAAFKGPPPPTKCTPDRRSSSGGTMWSVPLYHSLVRQSRTLRWTPPVEASICPVGRPKTAPGDCAQSPTTRPPRAKCDRKYCIASLAGPASPRGNGIYPRGFPAVGGHPPPGT